MTKPITALLAILILLSAAACSGSGTGASEQAADPSAAATPTLPATLPAPDADERKTLLAELAAINPEFTDDEAIDDARRVCGGLLGGVPLDNLLVTVADLFGSGRAVPVTDEDEAQQILRVIGANGFCR